MGLFSKKPKVEQCPMCDVELTPDDRWTHEETHIVQITADEPAWLPATLRDVAQGEFTFRCEQCNSYPSIKWPKPGGASAGMTLHLGHAHHRGSMAMAGVPVEFDMIPIS